MAVLRLPYRSPVWLRWWPRAIAGHAQTILPALFSPRPVVAYRRERWNTETNGELDGDFIDLDFVDTGDPTAPLIVLFHGLEGSSQSHYARALMHWVHAEGWMGIVVHFRGCSGEPNRTRRAYHSGDSTEIDWVLRRLAAENPDRKLYVVGVSLGGNALAKWLGEQAEQACFVERAVVISAPLDLTAGGRALSRGANILYTRMFLRTLKRKTVAKLASHPEIARGDNFIQAILKSRDLRDFDNLYTAPVHGFRDADDYWMRASAKPWLNRIAVPTLLVNARNDPFLPASALPHPHEVSPQVKLEQPEEGGHVGFAIGAFPGRLDWLPLRVLRWIHGH